MSALPAHEIMKWSHVARLKVFSALDAETLHAEGASQMVAVLCLLYHLVASWAHLNVFSFCCLIINGVEVILARETSVPRLFGQIAEFEIACGALDLKIMFRGKLNQL